VVLVDLDSTPGFSDESVRVYLATGLTDVGRPDAHDEEADMVLQWYALSDAVQMVLTGEIVNSIAAAGILAAHTARADGRQLRSVTAPWIDRPTKFAARQDKQ
jgi:8-oxo-dGDP phosphatase